MEAQILPPSSGVHFQKDRSFKLLFSDPKYFRALTEFCIQYFCRKSLPSDFLDQLQPYSSELIELQELKDHLAGEKPVFTEKMTDIAKSVDFRLANGSEIRFVFIYEEQSKVEQNMLFRASEYQLGQTWSSSEGNLNRSNVVLLTVVNMSFSEWTAPDNYFQSKGLYSEELLRYGITDIVEEFTENYHYNVISPLVIPEEALASLMRELRLIFLAIRYSRFQNDDLVNLIYSNPDFFGHLSRIEFGFICAYGNINQALIEGVLLNEIEERKYNMCNAIDYYVEKSNRKVAAQVAAEVTKEVTKEVTEEVTKEVTKEVTEKVRAEDREQYLKERNLTVFRAAQSGVSTEQISAIFQISDGEVKKIVAEFSH